MSHAFFYRLGLFVLLLSGFTGLAAEPQADKSPPGPLSPREELATFRVPKGFRVELVAGEPDVIDPVAMAFDEDGRLFVAEMRGYPNGGVATGKISSGKIKLLQDPDAKGTYRKVTTFAEGLRLPASVMPWKGGLLVAVAPDLIYLEDTDGDGKSDRRRTLYTGFDLKNSEQLLNGLQWGLDNWVYGCAGSDGGTISSPEQPAMKPLRLGSRGIRFHPEQPGSLEPMSGGGQFGLAADDWQHWFTATNSQHLRQIVLPDHYLRRNPYLAVTSVSTDIPDGKDGHGAVCKVFRLSPFEAWRVERTAQRVAGKVRGPTEGGAPGGFITSSCSPVVYTADLFPADYRNNTFVCEPANNLIHRDRLEPNGAIFRAARAHADCEFLASTDIWFRPVNLTVGPDGALYIVDFYREAIETPLSLPPEIKKKMNLESRGRGRIWRVVPEGTKPARTPNLRQATAEELVKQLSNPNSWRRLTAQRLLVERQDRSAIPSLKKLARAGESPQGRVHALWTLHGLKALDDDLIESALTDKVAEVREQALRLAESRLAASRPLQTAVAKLADDESPRVRFQLAFTLGEVDSPVTAAALAKVLRRDAADPWTQTAILSSAGRTAPALLQALVADRAFTAKPGGPQLQLLTRLAALVGAHSTGADLGRALALLGGEGGETWKLALLRGLGQGLQKSSRSLARLWEQPPDPLKDAVARAQPFFRRAADTARDPKYAARERLAAIDLLSVGPFAVAGPALQELLAPRTSGELQLAAVRALSRQDNPRVAEMLLAQWAGYGPAVRREVLEALFARPDRTRRLLDAVEKKTVLASQLEAARVEQLRKHPDLALRKQAQKLLAGRAAPDRQKAINEYRSALDLKADAAKGKLVFKNVCTTCHRLEDVGTEVGPDLRAALGNKTPEGLLVDILDPTREVDPRYVNYIVSTKAGRILTGIIVGEGDFQHHAPPRPEGRGRDPAQGDRGEGRHRRHDQVADAGRAGEADQEAGHGGFDRVSAVGGQGAVRRFGQFFSCLRNRVTASFFPGSFFLSPTTRHRVVASWRFPRSDSRRTAFSDMLPTTLTRTWEHPKDQYVSKRHAGEPYPRTLGPVPHSSGRSAAGRAAGRRLHRSPCGRAGRKVQRRPGSRPRNVPSTRPTSPPAR